MRRPLYHIKEQRNLQHGHTIIIHDAIVPRPADLHRRLPRHHAGNGHCLVHQKFMVRPCVAKVRRFWLLDKIYMRIIHKFCEFTSVMKIWVFRNKKLKKGTYGRHRSGSSSSLCRDHFQTHRYRFQHHLIQHSSRSVYLKTLSFLDYMAISSISSSPFNQLKSPSVSAKPCNRTQKRKWFIIMHTLHNTCFKTDFQKQLISMLHLGSILLSARDGCMNVHMTLIS